MLYFQHNSQTKSPNADTFEAKRAKDWTETHILHYLGYSDLHAFKKGEAEKIHQGLGYTNTLDMLGL